MTNDQLQMLRTRLVPSVMIMIAGFGMLAATFTRDTKVMKAALILIGAGALLGVIVNIWSSRK